MSSLRRSPRLFSVHLFTALFLGSVLAAACSDSGGSGADKAADGSGPAAEGADACELVTKAEIQTGLGVTLTDDGESNQVGPAANCDWNAAGQFVRLALVQAGSPGDASQTFDALDDRPGAQLVSGLGEKAVYLPGTPEAKNSQLFILSGKRMVTLSYCCASQEQLVDVGRKALGRLD